MWNASGASLPSVLIVENESGDVYIVENIDSKSQVDRILKTEKSTRSRKPEIKIEPYELTENELKQEIKEEEEVIIEEYLEECFENENDFKPYNVPFVDTNQEYQPNHESTVKTDTSKPAPNVFSAVKQSTFDGRWSSDDGEDADDDLLNSDSETFTPPNRKSNKSTAESRKSFWSHKMRSLAGKIACKYCDTVFASKSDQTMHVCKYLQCDPKNFVCRVCNKELSRKTFSNHLHETLDCQYCGKAFVNPRNMKIHIEKQHKDEEFVPPKKKNYDDYLKTKESIEAVLKESTSTKKVRNQTKKKKERFECDLCGKYLVSIRSMSFHMSLHTGNTCYICENCGEKFYTPNGIKGHSCEKKRRRPEKDFRTYDLRHCRFCDSYFGSFDENKAHQCLYQHPDDPKMVFCRCCGKILAKLAFNRHMEIHSGKDWICAVCDRKLATERALKVHMTTHSGNKPYKCKLCTETFINKVVLDRHMRFHGAATKVYRCEYCFKQLSTETSLKSHVQRLHKTTVQCELCKIEFPTRENLKVHLTATHEPSVCPICNKSFTLPRYLKMHEKLHYDAIPRIQCPVCSKLLGIKNIKSHVFRHHPEQFDEWQHSNPSL